jgi:hypothetical protein
MSVPRHTGAVLRMYAKKPYGSLARSGALDWSCESVLIVTCVSRGSSV